MNWLRVSVSPKHDNVQKEVIAEVQNRENSLSSGNPSQSIAVPGEEDIFEKEQGQEVGRCGLVSASWSQRAGGPKERGNWGQRASDKAMKTTANIKPQGGQALLQI